MAKIIAATCACGKTYYANNNPTTSIDLEYSHYAWITKDGKKVRDSYGNKIPNFAFPHNYIVAIKQAMQTHDYIFVTTHETVIRELIKEELPITVVIPSPVLKDTWIDRFVNRGDDEYFINQQLANWELWNAELYANRENFEDWHILGHDEYITTLIEEGRI